ncbi:hypothetical protein [Paenibacillus taichungensis]|uniref:hypothetical protein n=1 Tax=Paenibacillus taichungensis TaxID=484184 RepID=UPI0035E276E6
MVLSKKNRSKGKQADSASQTLAVSPGESKKQASTQAWVPIKDIHNNLLWRKDNHIVVVIRIEPVNIALLSKKEKQRKIKKLEEALNGVDYYYQILSIAKPVDLDAHIMKLEMAKKESDNPIQKKLLTGYAHQAAGKAMSGEALERHFYMLIPHILGKKTQMDEAVISDRGIQMASNLTHAELVSEVCNDQAHMDLQFLFSNPNQAAYERAPRDVQLLPPVMFIEEVYGE